MTFYVGQKVVCVDAGPGDYSRMVQLKKGHIYTVQSRPYPSRSTGQMVIDVGVGRGWRPNRFRPAVEKKTDISIFTALLNPANHKPLVDA